MSNHVRSPAPEPAPVAVFAYRRPAHLRRALEGLAASPLAVATTVHVFADGPRAGEARAPFAQVAAVARDAWPFRQLVFSQEEENRGLAANIVTGVNGLLAEHERVIVVEDDLEVSPGFLSFMNDALECYAKTPEVMQVAGYLPELEGALPETFFSPLTTSWGWATWRRAWQHFRPDAGELLEELDRSSRVAEYDLEGAYDFTAQLRANAEGRLRTWAVLWYTSVFLRRGLVLYPERSLVRNHGHDGSGTHSRPDARYGTGPLAEQVAVYPISLEIDLTAREAMRRRYHAPPPPRASLLRRLFRRRAS